ncbi:hypothetical protein DPMN_163280 [Dreissena polymorpha]|uniref:Uncharacterized protein n=1 Tax=Dreissena polymorpha TaxID=45954 RepID=A0A9D4ISN5_DREPO|nr:hypothetical protein DPMN_163280 [Dreissena polymorpha]
MAWRGITHATGYLPVPLRGARLRRPTSQRFQAPGLGGTSAAVLRTCNAYPAERSTSRRRI